MLMPERSIASKDYRFGYNKGSEKDDEISGKGNHFTTFYREGDTRLATWWSVDPKASEQPWQSPYSYMDGNPIQFIDEEGDFIGTLIGTVVGGAAGAYSAVKNKTSIKAGIAEGAASGFITGALVDLTVASGGTAVIAIVGASVVGGSIGAGAGDATGKFVGNLEKGQTIKQAIKNVKADNGTIGKMAGGAVTGLVGGVAGVGVGRVLESGVKAVLNEPLKTMSKNITATSEVLYGMKVSQPVVENAAFKITSGMGELGNNVAKTVTKIETATSTAVESSNKILDNYVSSNVTTHLNNNTQGTTAKPK
jgi:hypothetical protein